MAEARFMHLRIGDAERAEAVQMLLEHFGAGRLSPAEHEERTAKAETAVIRSEIETLFEDLPAPRPDMSAAQPPALKPDESRDTWLSHMLWVICGSLLFLGLPTAVVLGFTAGHWTLVPLAVIGFLAFGGMAEKAKKPRPQD